MAIILKEIKKSFGKKNVLNGINMELIAGNITGLLGANGSGKTTLMKIISGIYGYDSGTIENLVYVSKVLDVCNMTEHSSFNENMTVLQNLKYFIDLSIEKSADFSYYVDIFQIDFLNERFKKLSSGEKQKVALLYLFLKKSKILLLDEITNGLDERVIELFYKELKRYVKKNGIYTLISSHKIYELQEICDSVYLLDKGLIQQELKLDRKETNLEKRKVFVFENEDFAKKFMEKTDWKFRPILKENRVSVVWNDDLELKPMILSAMEYHLIGFSDDPMVLERYYFDFTGKE